MKKARYYLKTYTAAGLKETVPFEGTRQEARDACREIDQGRVGQVTHIEFVCYVE